MYSYIVSYVACTLYSILASYLVLVYAAVTGTKIRTDHYICISRSEVPADTL